MATPSVAVVARLILKDMKKDQRQYNRILKSILRDTESTANQVSRATRGMTKSFDEFLNTSRAMADVFGDSTRKGMQAAFGVTQDLRAAFDELGKGAQINIELFDQLTESGKGVNEAFALATSSTDSLAESKKRLEEEDRAWLVTLGKVTAAVAGVGAVLKTSKKLFEEAIESYRNLGDETRRIVIQTGLAAEEASIWAKTAELQNVSARSLAAGFAQVSRNLTNMQLKLAAGKEDNEIKDSQGNFKDTSQIISEVNEKIRTLGPGWQAAGVAQNIYGRGAISLLPIILDEAASIEDVTALMNEQNAVMTRLDQEGLAKVREAEARLNIARQGSAAILGREYIPIQARLINAYASIIEFVTKLDIHLRALTSTFGKQIPVMRALIVGFGTLGGQAASLGDIFQAAGRAAVDPTLTLADALEQVTGKGKETKGFLETYLAEVNRLKGLTEEAAEAQNKLTQEQQDAIDALFAEQESTEELNDALKDQKDILQDLTDAWNDYQNRIEDINRRFDDQLEDLEIRQGRARVERNLKLTHSLEDIYIKRDRKLRDLSLQLASKQQSLQRDAARKIQDFERDAARAREKIAVKHRENLLKIGNRFYDTVDEAARDNDTVAVVRAIRQRNRSLRDENRRFSVEQDELEKDLAIKRDKINEDARRREQEERQRADDRRARIQQQFRDEIDDLIRKNQRELILTRNKDEARRQDIERNRAQALRDAQIYYQREEQELIAHLNRVEAITRAWADRMAGIARSMFGAGTGSSVAPGITTGMPTPATGGSGILYDWLQGAGAQYRQHGGVDVVNRPTTFVAGEAGAEIAAFIPLSQSRNINHNFGKLPIDFQGLPGGMDTSQVQSIVYGAMMELARTLGTSTRR
jgi:hypothetical protein